MGSSSADGPKPPLPAFLERQFLQSIAQICHQTTEPQPVPQPRTRVFATVLPSADCRGVLLLCEGSRVPSTRDGDRTHKTNWDPPQVYSPAAVWKSVRRAARQPFRNPSHFLTSDPSLAEVCSAAACAQSNPTKQDSFRTLYDQHVRRRRATSSSADSPLRKCFM